MTYFVTINSEKSEYTNICEAVAAIKEAIFNDDEATVTLAASGVRGVVWSHEENSFSTLNEFLLEEISMDKDLDVILTVEGGNNGYPSGLESAITGFENWEQAQEIADEYGLQLVWLHRRDGWSAWERDNMAYDPIDVLGNPECLGYYSAEICTPDEYYEAERELLADYDTEEEAQTRLAEIDEVCDLLKVRGENQVVLTSDGLEPMLCDRYLISYSYDVHEYCLGAVVL